MPVLIFSVFVNPAQRRKVCHGSGADWHVQCCSYAKQSMGKSAKSSFSKCFLHHSFYAISNIGLKSFRFAEQIPYGVEFFKMFISSHYNASNGQSKISDEMSVCRILRINRLEDNLSSGDFCGVFCLNRLLR